MNGKRDMIMVQHDVFHILPKFSPGINTTSIGLPNNPPVLTRIRALPVTQRIEIQAGSSHRDYHI
jgi:hypothetical protein